MVDKSPNHLMAFARKPALHISLPSGGVFFPENSFFPDMSGDIQVYSMRTADELLLKSPDALYSGYAVESLIKSCCPGIKEPRLVSSSDLDVILLAIRAATSGTNLEISVICPHCNTEHSYGVDIPAVLSTVVPITGPTSVRISPEVVVNVRPHNLENDTKLTMAGFAEQRKLQTITEDTDLEVKSKLMNEAHSKLIKLGIAVTADCVINVVTPFGITDNKEHIKEFIENIDRDSLKKIEDAISDFYNKGIDKKLNMTCTNCEKDWETVLELDPSSFFVPGS